MALVTNYFIISLSLFSFSLVVFFFWWFLALVRMRFFHIVHWRVWRRRFLRWKIRKNPIDFSIVNASNITNSILLVYTHRENVICFARCECRTEPCFNKFDEDDWKIAKEKFKLCVCSFNVQMEANILNQNRKKTWKAIINPFFDWVSENDMRRAIICKIIPFKIDKSDLMIPLNGEWIVN